MEDRKTIFDYIGQVFMIFGITMGIMSIFCLWFGEDAQTYSTMFALGKEGISIDTMMQFLLVSVCTVGLRFLFFTEQFIKNMTIPLRTVAMLASEIAVIALFVFIFKWFPADMWSPWVMFIFCFGICFAVSLSVTVIKERMENKQMEEALERLKKEEVKKEEVKKEELK